jgi:hypothetical protein
MKATFAAAAALLALVSVAEAQTLPTPPPAGAQGVAPETLLPALIEHSRRVGAVENGRITGDAGAFLRTLGAEAQFVLIGEEHGNAGIADFIAAYWRDLREAGYSYAAVEIDPWTAQAMERELRAGGVDRWREFVAAGGGATAAPFFTWAPEARFAQTVVDSTPANGEPNIWGLDQVFLGGVSWMLRDVAAHAHDEQARTMAASLAEQARGSLDWLGRADAQPLIDLRARLGHRRDRAHAALLDAMLQSQRIYRPFTAGGGEAYFANSERETLMKRTFLERYRAAERADRAPPRVMLKFGSNHMVRGATPTHVQGLGGFVTEFAVQNGTNALSINVACGPGGVVGTFDNPSVPCAPYFAETWSFLAPYVDPTQVTVFDLRAWRLRPRRWQHLSADMRQLIDSYDLLVFPPAAPASEFLPGLALPPRG